MPGASRRLAEIHAASLVTLDPITDSADRTRHDVAPGKSG
jgi:hypothetical protein